MKPESKYYGNMMKKYSTRDTAEWIIGAFLCLISVPLLHVSLFLCVVLGVAGIATLAYCSGKEAVTMRMLHEEIGHTNISEMLREQNKL